MADLCSTRMNNGSQAWQTGSDGLASSHVTDEGICYGTVVQSSPVNLAASGSTGAVNSGGRRPMLTQRLSEGFSITFLLTAEDSTQVVLKEVDSSIYILNETDTTQGL